MIAAGQNVSVQIATRAHGVPRAASLRHWARAALAQKAEVTVRVVGSREARQLNHRFRGRDYATNVLSFAYAADESRPGGPGNKTDTVMGDIVLCATVISREARVQHKSLPAHYAHLTIHGALHLQGYDHESAQEALKMERRERRILRELGYPDPYL